MADCQGKSRGFFTHSVDHDNKRFSSRILFNNPMIDPSMRISFLSNAYDLFDA
jgi:hypothetical protein